MDALEVIKPEDGFNVVVIRCDHCATEIPQVRQADSEWITMKLTPLARDHWNQGDSLGEYHFCSTRCFRATTSELNPHADNNEESKA